jgi:hypothetical protein
MCCKMVRRLACRHFFVQLLHKGDGSWNTVSLKQPTSLAKISTVGRLFPRYLYQDPSIYIHVTVHRKRFLLNNHPDALIIPVLFCYKTLHVSSIFSVHHQEFSTVHSALVSFIQVFYDRFQAEWGCSTLNLLGNSHQKSAWNLASAECTVENSWWWAEKMPETCRVL